MNRSIERVSAPVQPGHTAGVSREAATLVLIGNAFAFNLGFYMVLPYLFSYMQADLAMQAATIGLVLGIRVLSQQGLFLMGGWLGDLWGYRPTIIWGCALRAAGFLMLGNSLNLYGLLLGAAFTGLAGALFTPSSQAYLSLLHPDETRRRQVFVWHHWMSQAGMLLGPLVGLWAGTHGFRITALVAGGLFGVFMLVQWRLLPAETALSGSAKQADVPSDPQAGAWRGLLRHRTFWLFSLWSGGYSILFQQLYLAVPAHLQAQQTGAAPVTHLFTLTAVFSIALQWPASRYLAPLLGTARAMGMGLMLMGLAYGSLLVLEPGRLAVVSMVFALLFSAGSVLVYPLINSEVARYAPSVSRARYYGLLAGVGGLMSLIGNMLVGAALDRSPHGPEAGLWWVLCACGVGSGVLLWRHVHRQSVGLLATKAV